MAHVIQIIDVGPEGHTVRLSDGRKIQMPHGEEHPRVGHAPRVELEADNDQLRAKIQDLENRRLADAQTAAREIQRLNDELKTAVIAKEKAELALQVASVPVEREPGT